jgi:hypothetical protein
MKEEDRMKSVLVFIDGTICDDRQRFPFLETEAFSSHEKIMADSA